MKRPLHIDYNVSLQIMETDEVVELRWHIPLNGSTSKISKVDRYLKNGEVVEGARRDGRAGVLRSQLTFTPEGHVHIRYKHKNFGKSASLSCYKCETHILPSFHLMDDVKALVSCLYISVYTVNEIRPRPPSVFNLTHFPSLSHVGLLIL